MMPALRLLVCIGFVALLLGATTTATTQPQQRVWRTRGVETAKSFSLADVRCDTGMHAKPAGAAGPLELSVDGKPYSDLLLLDRADYDEHAAVVIDVPAIKGSLTLQAICYDERGEELRAVDLLENIESPGSYECPMKIYRTPLKGTRQISFKLWLGGGERPAATVSAIDWGVVK